MLSSIVPKPVTETF